jgi:hypothetical protein
MLFRKTRRGQSTVWETPLVAITSTGFVRNCFQQYRWFFRYHASSKLLVFLWGNDEDSKRALFTIFGWKCRYVLNTRRAYPYPDR